MRRRPAPLERAGGHKVVWRWISRGCGESGREGQRAEPQGDGLALLRGDAFEGGAVIGESASGGGHDIEPGMMITPVEARDDDLVSVIPLPFPERPAFLVGGAEIEPVRMRVSRLHCLSPFPFQGDGMP